MIRLDAATVLLQWSVGGMAFCWFTTRRREVGLGYGWLLRGTYALIASGAAVIGLRYGDVRVRDAAAIGVVIGCVVALVASITRRSAGVRGQRAEHDRRSERVAAMTGIDRTSTEAMSPASASEFPPVLDLVPAAVGVIGLIAAAIAAAPDGGGDGVVSVLRTLVGAAFLGASPTRCCSAIGTSCSRGYRGGCSTSWSARSGGSGRSKWPCCCCRPGC